MNFIYELLRAGTNVSNSDSGSEVARKFNDNFQKVQDKFTEIDQQLAEYGDDMNILEALKETGMLDPVLNTGATFFADNDGNIYIL